MYRIASEQNLTLLEIADNWSREISPKRTSIELEKSLIQAWWRGELQATGNITRLKAIDALFTSVAARPLFWVNGEPEPKTIWEHPDGSAEVFIGPILKVPSHSPDEWSDENCNDAFEEIAKDWDNQAFDLIRPIISETTLSERDFTAWIKAKGHDRPEFWVEPKSFEADRVLKAPKTALKKISKNKAPDFVRLYQSKTLGAGDQPTKVGLERYSLAENYDGTRDSLRNAFDEIMGGNAPGRGRPKKSRKINRH